MFREKSFDENCHTHPEWMGCGSENTRITEQALTMTQDLVCTLNPDRVEHGRKHESDPNHDLVVPSMDSKNDPSDQASLVNERI